MTFASGETSKSIIFGSTQDSIDNDGESVKLSFGSSLPAGVEEGTTKETIVSITDDDDPAVTVSFGSPTYSVPEGGTQSVTVRLSPDPERSVVIRISAAGQDGAVSGDYSITPASLTFNSGGREQKTFTFTAVGDTDDDDGESVKLSFRSLPDGVTASGTTETVVSIRDDDDPAVTVKFGASTYPVEEGGSVEVTVTLSADPERTVDIPLSAAKRGGLEDADYRGVPPNVTFSAGGTPGPREQTFSVTTTDDRINDDGESLRLTFGSPLPASVSTTSPSSATVRITDDDDAGVTLSKTSLDIDEGGSGELHGGADQRAHGRCHDRVPRAGGFGSDRQPQLADLHQRELGVAPDRGRLRGRRQRFQQRHGNHHAPGQVQRQRLQQPLRRLGRGDRRRTTRRCRSRSSSARRTTRLPGGRHGRRDRDPEPGPEAAR